MLRTSAERGQPQFIGIVPGESTVLVFPRPDRRYDCKVVGTVVATRKDPKINGLKFLLLRQVNPETMKEGTYVVANDAVGCGVGEYVLYASGSSARQTEVTKDRPCDAVIMAIVDSWEIGGVDKYKKM